MTTTATATITHTFVNPNLQSNINNLSITNGMLLGSIENTKLVNSSITLNGQSMNLGSVYSLPNTSITNTMLAGSIDNSKLTNSSITIGTTAMSLGSTYTTITGGTPLNTY